MSLHLITIRMSEEMCSRARFAIPLFANKNGFRAATFGHIIFCWFRYSLLAENRLLKQLMALIEKASLEHSLLVQTHLHYRPQREWKVLKAN